MLITVVLLGLASGAASTTIASSRIFKWLRTWIAGRNEFLGELISCSYCLGHWVSAFLVWLWAYFIGQNIILLVTAWLASTAVSALVSGTISRLYLGDDHDN